MLGNIKKEIKKKGSVLSEKNTMGHNSKRRIITFSVNFVQRIEICDQK